MLDIHALQVFYEAAQAGNFTIAAHILNMTQPAVSMQIKTLEDYLQVELFERQGRTMHLTKAGQALIPYARQMIEMALRTEEFIRAANDEVLGNLVVGCSLPSANQVLMYLAARFQHHYPLVKMRVPTVSRAELIEKIVSGQYDFGMMHVINRCAPLECIPLFQDEIVLIAPSDHPFSERGAVLPTDLQGQRFVCQGEGTACRYAVRDALAPYGVDLAQFDVRMEVGNHGAIIVAVEYGVGLAFVSRIEAIEALARGKVRLIDVEGVRLMTSVGLAFSTAQTTSLIGVKFKNFLMHPRTRAEVHQLTHTTAIPYKPEESHA